MGRTIKFRAWQTVTKTMFSNIEKGTGAPDGNPPFADYLENPHMVVMQFTGWHDKNGEPVYEGDVIQLYTYRGVVVWDDATDSWRIRVRDIFNLRDSSMVVIGNIYKHPELLKNGGE